MHAMVIINRHVNMLSNDKRCRQIGKLISIKRTRIDALNNKEAYLAVFSKTTKNLR